MPGSILSGITVSRIGQTSPIAFGVSNIADMRVFMDPARKARIPFSSGEALNPYGASVRDASSPDVASRPGGNGAASTQGSVRVGEGVWRISVPVMEIPTVATFVYAVEAGPRLLLIDAGWNDPIGWEALQAGFAHAGLDMTAVEGVILTHHHPDHSGLAGQVQNLADCWIAMHEADCDLLQEVADLISVDKHEEWETDNLRKAGASQADIDAFVRQGSMAASTRPTMPDRKLTDREAVTCEDRTLTVIATPGHTPGHMCLAESDRQLLFSGDHILSRTTPHIGQYDYPLDVANPLEDYFRSLQRIRPLQGWTIHPAHEGTIEDLGARLSEIEAHHCDRLNDVMSILADQPLSLWAVTAALKWQGKWEDLPPISRQLALAEAAAHVQYLVRLGRVRRIGGFPETFLSTSDTFALSMAPSRGGSLTATTNCTTTSEACHDAQR